MRLNKNIGEAVLKLKIKSILHTIKEYFKHAGIYCPHCGKKMGVDYIQCKPICKNCGFEFRN